MKHTLLLEDLNKSWEIDLVDNVLLINGKEMENEEIAYKLSNYPPPFEYFVERALSKELRGDDEEIERQIGKHVESVRNVFLDSSPLPLSMALVVMIEKRMLTIRNRSDLPDDFVAWVIDSEITPATREKASALYEMTISIAANPHTKPTHLELLAKDASHDVLKALLENKSATNQCSRNVIEHNRTSLPIKAIERWKGFFPPDLAKQLMVYPEATRILARRKNLASVQELLSRSPDLETRRALATNLTINEKTKKFLASGDDYGILWELTNQHYLSKAVMQLLGRENPLRQRLLDSKYLNQSARELWPIKETNEREL